MYSQLQQRIASVNSNIVHLRKQGMIVAFDVQTQNPNFPRDCYSKALALGLLLRPIGNTVYFMPPYIISESEIDFMLETALSAVTASI
jgi:adenosylmethionine-8-amino-7-oxononanoate aminotransferase